MMAGLATRVGRGQSCCDAGRSWRRMRLHMPRTCLRCPLRVWRGFRVESGGLRVASRGTPGVGGFERLAPAPLMVTGAGLSDIDTVSLSVAETESTSEESSHRPPPAARLLFRLASAPRDCCDDFCWV